MPEFKIPESVLVVIYSSEMEVLLIERADKQGFWQSVTGSKDAVDEPLIETAIREVQEETGIQNIQLHELLNFTNHLYFDTYLNEEVVKRTYWFHMTIAVAQDGTPQSSEDIEKIEWHSLATAKKCLEQTYPTILEVVEAYRLKINQ
jgi:8-oxo-dGTP pyrophosphatase MutT (NUDIX family)